MELQNQRKAPIRKARPPSGKTAKGGSRLQWPPDLEKNVRLVLGALLFVASTWWALTRYSRPDPFRKPELFSWAWLIHPLEANAPARLPVVSGTLTSLDPSEDGTELLVAGQQGTVLRYQASNQQWENLSVPDSLGRGPLAPGRYRAGWEPRSTPRRREDRGTRSVPQSEKGGTEAESYGDAPGENKPFSPSPEKKR